MGLFDPGRIHGVENHLESLCSTNLKLTYQSTRSFDALICWYSIHFGLILSPKLLSGAFCEDSGGFGAEIKHARTTEERQAGAKGRLGSREDLKVGMWSEIPS